MGIAALYVDFRVPALRIPVTVIYVLVVIAILLKSNHGLVPPPSVLQPSASCSRGGSV